mmetsp:Transcript_66841/g.196208  ORF Transcript_66841/g.196208 Transcript_66841/m.196208 type:complete len:212 (+) Transcript_66841:1111-1746(+)
MGREQLAHAVRRRGAALLPDVRQEPLQLHWVRQHGQRQQPPRLGVDLRVPPLLGERHAGGRLPLRPRLLPRPRERPLQPHEGERAVQHHRPALREEARERPDDDGREAHRRALGLRLARWLPGRPVPRLRHAALGRVEREVPRRRAQVPQGRRGQEGRLRHAHLRQRGPLPGDGQGPGALHQLHHGARRLHAAGPRVLQQEEQRGQQRGEW